MDVSTGLLLIYLSIATGAFLITQLHLLHQARKIIKGSKASWDRAERTIFDAEKVIHDDVVAQILKLQQESPMKGAEMSIAELRAKVDAFESTLDDRMFKLQGGVKESFVTFADSLGKNLENLLSRASPTRGFGVGADPREAQSAGVESRKVNQIMSVLETGAATGGNVLGAVNQLAQFLAEMGEPNLADWLQEHPNTLPQIYSRIQRNPRLAQALMSFENRIGGNGGAAGQPSQRSGFNPG